MPTHRRTTTTTKRSPSHHDALFKQMFQRRRVAVAALRRALPPALVDRLDFRTLAPAPAAFVDDRLKLRHGDLLVTVRLRGGRRTLIYVLIEHQSEPDPLMAFRTLRYMVRIWEALLEDQPRRKRLPAVIPVVLHHGRRRWPAPTDFAALIDLQGIPREAVSPFLPAFRFLLDDVARASDANLRARSTEPALTATLLLLSRARTSPDLIADLERFRGTFARLERAPGGVVTLRPMWQYALEVGRCSPARLFRFARSLGPIAKEAYMTGAQQLTQKALKEGLSKGLSKGLSEGLSKGRAEGKADVVLKQLRLKFGPVPADVSARVREGTAARLDRWALRLLTVDTLCEVFGKATARRTTRTRRAG